MQLRVRPGSLLGMFMIGQPSVPGLDFRMIVRIHTFNLYHGGHLSSTCYHLRSTSTVHFMFYFKSSFLLDNPDFTI